MALLITDFDKPVFSAVIAANELVSCFSCSFCFCLFSILISLLDRSILTAAGFSSS